MDRPSYETINYDLRPAKSIERKMMAEALRALILFAPMKEYLYRGFGSPYFSDFALFHRVLGISKMESIEKDEYNRGRFEFNRPLGCIKLRFGKSTDVLPALIGLAEQYYGWIMTGSSPTRLWPTSQSFVTMQKQAVS